MGIVGADGKPVFSDVRKETLKRFINICLHPVPSIAQKPLRAQLESWLASMTSDDYNKLYLHIRSLDKRGLAVMAQQIIAVVRAAHLKPKEDNIAQG